MKHAPILVAGCMTGTSLDGLDIAFVEIQGEGLDLSTNIRQHQGFELGSLADQMRPLALGGSTTIENLWRIRADLSNFHAECIRSMPGYQDLQLVSVHGQTLFHKPPLSCQLIDAAIVAHRLHCPVVYDMRAADLACGGQGAPITPLADRILYWQKGRRSAIVNLGGFCNITLLPGSGQLDEIKAFDLCACNQLLDVIARRRLDKPFDRDGQAAMGGKIHDGVVASLLAHIQSQSAQRRSLGSGDELSHWVDTWQEVPAGDLLASTCQALARHTATAIGEVDEVVLAGGGAYNQGLVSALETHCHGSVVLSSAHGIPISVRESTAMAVLGHLCKNRIPVTLPQVTLVKVPAPISGHLVYP